MHDPQRRPMPAPHQHHEWEVNLIARGWAEYIVDGQRRRWPVDTLAWLLPHQAHLLIDRSPDLRMWVMVFHPTLMAESLRRVRLTPTHPTLGTPRLLTEPQATALDALARRLIDSNDQTADTPQHRLGLNYLAGECLAAAVTAQDLPAGSHLHPAVEQAARLLHDDPAIDDLDVLADRCHVSRPHLSRLFRQQLGLTLTDYRNRRRVNRFTELLGRGGRTPCTQAAYAAGFGSYTQAYRAVRQLHGKSPRHLTHPPPPH